jgi:hypothetical protein
MSKRSLAENEDGAADTAVQTKQPNRVLGYFKNQTQRVWSTSKELALSPFRVLTRTGVGIAADGKRIYDQALPTALVGVPLAMGVAALGGAPYAAAMAVGVRFGSTTDSVLGGVLSGACGFLLAAACFLWALELAALWMAYEVFAMVAKAAERAEVKVLAARPVVN